MLFLLSTALPPSSFTSFSLTLSFCLSSAAPLTTTTTPPYTHTPLLLSLFTPLTRSLNLSFPFPPSPPLFSLSFSPSISFLSLSPSLHSSPAHSSFSFSSYLPPSFLFLSYTHKHAFKHTPCLSFSFLTNTHSLSLSDYLKAVIINDMVIRASRSTPLTHAHAHLYPCSLSHLSFCLFSVYSFLSALYQEKEAAFLHGRVIGVEQYLKRNYGVKISQS